MSAGIWLVAEVAGTAGAAVTGSVVPAEVVRALAGEAVVEYTLLPHETVRTSTVRATVHNARCLMLPGKGIRTLRIRTW